MPIRVLGAGGHAKVAIATLQAMGRTVAAAFDDDARLVGRRVLDVRVAGPLNDAAREPEAPAFIGIGDNAARRRVAEKLALPWMTAVHPWTHVHVSVAIARGALVAAGAVIQPDSIVGAHAIVNTSASVDHDCSLGPFAHVGPGARLAGGVHVGEGALVGVGASVAPGVRIGDWAIIGAGSAVIMDVPPHAIHAGVPARPLKPQEGP